MKKRFAIASASIVGLILLYVAYIFITLPDVDQIQGCFTTTMYGVDICPGSPNYVTLDRISPHVKNAIVISEDSAFYQHNGFDFSELQNSVETNMEKGAFARGGSTITQQLAKNAFLNGEKSITRKIKEALLTRQLEERLSKSQILEKYLNIVEFGPGIYGIKAASQHYFKKNPEELNPLESAFLAFLLPNPRTHSVSYSKQSLSPFAKKRVRQILTRMFQYSRLTAEERIWALENMESFPWFELKDVPEKAQHTTDDGPILDLIEKQVEDDVNAPEGESGEYENPF